MIIQIQVLSDKQTSGKSAMFKFLEDGAATSHRQCQSRKGWT